MPELPKAIQPQRLPPHYKELLPMVLVWPTPAAVRTPFSRAGDVFAMPQNKLKCNGLV